MRFFFSRSFSSRFSFPLISSGLDPPRRNTHPHPIPIKTSSPSLNIDAVTPIPAPTEPAKSVLQAQKSRTSRSKVNSTGKEPESINVPITISSIPMGALVNIDGTEVGRTLLIDHSVSAGSHSIELILGEDRIAEQITITPTGSRRFQWHVEQQKWRSYSD